MKRNALLTPEVRAKAQAARVAEIELPGDPRLLRRAEAVPKLYRRAYVKAVTGQARGLRELIRLKCLDCCCWQRGEITLCTTVGCPLWHVRPYQEQILTVPGTGENLELAQDDPGPVQEAL